MRSIPESVSNLVDGTDEMLEELRKIRTLLEPKPSPPAPKGMRAEFAAFIKKYQVMGLAVAFILGIYLGAVVQGLVNYILMPIIQLAIPGTAWQNITAGPFQVGAFAGTVVTFLIVAGVIFLIVKLTTKYGIQ